MSRCTKKHTIGFKCSSGITCRYLWRCALEQMLFFTQNAAVVSGGGFFSWGTKFKYTGRTEREILTESINALREQKLNYSTTSNRKASSVPVTPSSPQGDFEQIRYSSLPRSTMSEPLNYCNTAATESLNNIVLFQGEGYDESDIAAVQLPSLEPVSEEARLCAFSKFDILNHVGSANIDPEDSTYFITPEETMVYSSLMSDNSSYFTQPRISKNPVGQIFKCSSQNRNERNSTLNNFGSPKAPTLDNVIQQNSANSAKMIRKFRIINVFIPSIIFVAIVMTISAIFIIESESNLFKQIRNLPEMVSLRYQYYQPIKEYICNKLGLKI